ncbi:MAG TPA: redoxin domain-containing protein [Myxococcota bacterium]|nr:redoxin domain-containing protein [Myxococcota bacterium]
MRIILSIVGVTLLLSCAPKAEVDELSARVEALEKRVEAVESRPASSTASAGPTAAEEAEAQKIYGEINESLAAGDMETAKAKTDVCLKDYGRTKTASRCIRIKQELDVVGKSVDNPAVEKWFVGDGDIDLQNGTTLLVFWEVWCPHCQREVPELQATHAKYQGKGLEVVALTKITKSATEEKVADFVSESGVTYRVAKEDGSTSSAFAVSGIPAAAVVKDGEVLWRGHPGRLNDEMLEKFLGS